MSKPFHALLESFEPLSAEGVAAELSSTDLSSILGGQAAQSRSNPESEFFDQLKETGNTILETVEPLLAPVRETVELAVAAGNYARWAVEHTNSHEISEQRGQQLEREAREAQEARDAARAAEQDRLLSSNRPTSSSDAAQFLGDTNGYQGQAPEIPTYLTQPSGDGYADVVIEDYSGPDNWSY